MEAEEIRSALKQFIGTVYLYATWTPKLRYTDGIKFLADSAKAYWLIDVIASWQPRALRDPALCEFQLWELFVQKDHSANIVCSRDSEDPVFRQRIRWTDCPLDYVKLYVEQGVLMLPTEH